MANLRRQVVSADDALAVRSSARLSDGVIDLDSDRDTLAALLAAVPADKIDPDMLTFSLPFSQRRRGVDARLTIGKPPAERDDIPLANIARETTWLEEMKAGADYASIAARHGTTANYVAQMLPFAFLAPNLARSVLAPIDYQLAPPPRAALGLGRTGAHPGRCLSNGASANSTRQPGF